MAREDKFTFGIPTKKTTNGVEHKSPRDKKKRLGVAQLIHYTQRYNHKSAKSKGEQETERRGNTSSEGGNFQYGLKGNWEKSKSGKRWGGERCVVEMEENFAPAPRFVSNKKLFEVKKERKTKRRGGIVVHTSQGGNRVTTKTGTGF